MWLSWGPSVASSDYLLLLFIFFYFIFYSFQFILYRYIHLTMQFLFAHAYGFHSSYSVECKKKIVQLFFIINSFFTAD